MIGRFDQTRKPTQRYRHGTLLPLQSDDAAFWKGRESTCSMKEWRDAHHNRALWWRRLFARAASSERSPIPRSSEAHPTTAHVVEADMGTDHGQ